MPPEGESLSPAGREPALPGAGDPEHYGLDDLGRVAEADIVTPTAINQAAMEAQLLADLADITDEAELATRAERIVRAFDPCISCSVHLLRLG